jgi:hypothetical protein
VLIVIAFGHGGWPDPFFGVDFKCYWSAASRSLARDVAGALDLSSPWPDDAALLHPGKPYPFLYPPSFLLLLLPFGALPFGAAFFLWDLLGFVALLTAARAVIRDHRLLPVLLTMPGLWLVLYHGQNALFLGAALALGMVNLWRRPALAGICLALLGCKPQLALLLPVAMIAGGHWRALGAATVGMATLSFASVVVLGIDSWIDFVRRLRLMSQRLMSGMDPIFIGSLQSPFGLAFDAGLTLTWAMGVQLGVMLLAAATVARCWRSDAEPERKAAVLVLCSALATPYLLFYDASVLWVAFAFLAVLGRRRGYPDWQITLLAALWFLPAPVVLLLIHLHRSFSVVPILLIALLAVTLGDRQIGQQKQEDDRGELDSVSLRQNGTDHRAQPYGEEQKSLARPK